MDQMEEKINRLLSTKRIGKAIESKDQFMEIFTH